MAAEAPCPNLRQVSGISDFAAGTVNCFNRTAPSYLELILTVVSFLDSAAPVRYALAFLALSPLFQASSKMERKVL
jgi:hypothetical protein